ncbi:MAG: formate dehydrogenase accessory protein FdhE [Myxococcales bacterium]|nr:formate dehydrogenase accessory protein FdhE [Myxococcales bacterium]
MTSSTAARLLSPEEIAVRAGGEIPFLRFPDRTTAFGEREMRLRQLRAGHAMGDYLGFIAEVAQAQGAVLGATIDVALPTAEQIERAAKAGVPLLDAAHWQRDPRWVSLLRDLLRRLDVRLGDGATRAIVRGLAARDDAWLDQQADRILNGVMLGLDLGSAPLVSAGLQVYFAHLVAATLAAGSGARLAPFGRIDDESICPCCGSRPTAGITRIGAAEAGYRYLACSLCATQWHMVRIKCSHCLSTKGITYQSLRTLGQEEDAAGSGRVEGANASTSAVQLECCSECGHYLKIVHMERDPNVEPTADDLATLTLDLLANDGGETRHGVNLMLFFGDPDAPDGGGG